MLQVSQATGKRRLGHQLIHRRRKTAPKTTDPTAEKIKIQLQKAIPEVRIESEHTPQDYLEVNKSIKLRYDKHRMDRDSWDLVGFEQSPKSVIETTSNSVKSMNSGNSRVKLPHKYE